MLRNIQKVAMMMAMVFAASLKGYAQASFAITLEAHAETNGEVELSWNSPLGTAVEYYSIYRAEISGGAGFSVIDSTTDTRYEDHLSISAATSFAYYVEGRMAGGGTVRSNSVIVKLLNGSDVVRIISRPPLDATVSVQYMYQVEAKSSDSTAVLFYHLEKHPEGMTIDANGVIIWTPSEQGWAAVEVVVTSSGGGSAHQAFAIRVGSGTGIVSGTVTDSLGGPVVRVMIKLYERSRVRHFEYHAITDSFGHYTIRGVNPGTYYARAIPLRSGYMPQWYDGVRSRKDATPITVQDKATTEVNFNLKSRSSSLPTYVVSGSVTDSTGIAIAGASVLFVRTDFAFNSSREGSHDWTEGDCHRDIFDHRSWLFNDFRIEGNSHAVVRAAVDPLTGKYTVRLYAGSYIALAYAAGFGVVFFDGKTDFMSADVIELAGDLPGINFILYPVSSFSLGTISGKVIDSLTGEGVQARIIAYRDRWMRKDTMIAPPVYFADADEAGNYTLERLAPGEYVLLAVPLGNYIPSFYSANGPTLRWRNATRVGVQGNTVTGIDIYVVPRLQPAIGYTSIYGSVTANASGSVRDGGSEERVEISGALVYAVGSDGSVAGFAITDTRGSFTIDELAPGTYQVYVDKPGYNSSTSSASPTYDADGNPQPSMSNFTIESATSVGAGLSLQPSGYALEQNYPNPFNPTTKIVFSIPQSQHVTLVIFSMTGERIATLINEVLDAGPHAVMWNGRDDKGVHVASGIYFYKITTQSFTSVKKMTLLK